jgi:ribosomal protein L9
MPKPLKHLGEYEVPVRVHPELAATVRVEVIRGT